MAFTSSESISAIQRPLFSLPAHPGVVGALERKGAVYTKLWVVDLILDLAGYLDTENLVDLIAVEPCVGDGAFLSRMIERLIRSCNRMGRPHNDCRPSLIAFELDPQSAKNAKELAIKVLEAHGVDCALAKELSSSWVRTGDYLVESLDVQADFVIGNPPYVRLEEIPDQTCDVYRNLYRTMRGRADIYIGFFEAALRQLRGDGVCAFICADRWMRNQYGSELRRLITSNFAVDAVVEMHHAVAFEDEVDAYPAITILRFGQQGKTTVASLGDLTQGAMAVERTKSFVQGMRNPDQVIVGGVQTAAVDCWFQGAEPWACSSPAQLKLLRRIESSFSPLEATARVGIGVASGSDRIFITKNPNIVESSRLLKLALAKDIRGGSMQWSGHFLIDPWNELGLVELDQFPRLKAYLDTNAEALKERHVGQNNLGGWFRTIDRVSHDLTHKPKLYIADIKERLEPVLDIGETYPHHNLYFVQSDVWDLEVLGALLMSSVGQFFLKSYAVKMRGGYLRFQAQYLRRIRIPDPASIPGGIAVQLREAFIRRDICSANRLALGLYGIEAQEMETALEY